MNTKATDVELTDRGVLIFNLLIIYSVHVWHFE